MKKILSIILALTFCLIFAACGEKEPTKEDITSSATSSVEETPSDAALEEEEKEELVLKNDGEYVILALTSNGIKINSEDDFENYSIGYIDDTDGMRYAEYYSFKSTGMYNAANDLHSGLSGGSVDLAIVDKDAVSAYTDWEIVWEMK